MINFVSAYLLSQEHFFVRVGVAHFLLLLYTHISQVQETEFILTTTLKRTFLADI